MRITQLLCKPISRSAENFAVVGSGDFHVVGWLWLLLLLTVHIKTQTLSDVKTFF
jgi:hypothetical protein